MLIILDTLARAMVGGDENSAEDMGLFIDAAKRIRQATHATVLVIHHNNRAGVARGSTALLGAVHTILECSREQHSKHLSVKCGKQKDADHFAEMKFEAVVVELGQNPETGRNRSSLVLEPRSSQVLQATQGERSLMPTSQQALTAFVDLGVEVASFSQWRDAANIKARSTFTHVRNELEEGGYVEHLDGGGWRLTQKGRVQGSRGSI